MAILPGPLPGTMGPPPMGGPPSGAMGSPPMMGGPPMGPPPDIISMIGAMARMPRENSQDKIKRAMKILGQVREEDEKVAPIISMAMDVLRNGPEATPDGGTREANNSPRPSTYLGT